jgi:REP element-mobilizing transposase RayT
MKTAQIRAEIELDAWVVMPNHVHAIVVISDDDQRRRRGDRPVAPTMPMATIAPGPQPRSIGALMAGFKSAVTKRMNQLRQTPGAAVWQRNYWERIIRDEAELEQIKEYIYTNPAQWDTDKMYERPNL